MKTLINNTKYIFATLFLIIFISSCENDDTTINNNQNSIVNNQNASAFVQNFGNQASHNFLGNVIDINNNPIQDVSISIGNSSAVTDQNGVFIINDASVYENFAYIKAQKSGYFLGSRSLIPTQGTNKVTIMLLENSLIGSVTSGTTETLSLQNGASVTLNGSYINEDGSEYTGTVNVAMHFLDPTNNNIQYQMPGMLYASNYNNEERMLQTFGMLAVELKGSNNESLNIAPNSDAQITVPLDNAMLTNAPSTIPLWYFNETYGYWQEEGEATLVGNSYVGTVKHFSFWNCDIPAQAVNFCITLNDENGNALDNVLVSLESQTYGRRGGVTNNLGKTCGLVPRGEVLELYISTYGTCASSPFYTATIGPFLNDESYTLNLPFNNNYITETINGNFNSCSGDPITNGYVEIRHDNKSYYSTVTNGSFSQNLLRCVNNNTFSVKGIDYNNQQTTNTINYTFTTPITNIGTVNSCNTSSEFIQYTIDNGNAITIISQIDSSLGNGDFGEPLLYISAFEPGINECFSITGYLNNAPYIGTYDKYTGGNDTGFAIEECFDINNQLPNTINFHLNSLGNVGEYIDINFSGNYLDDLGTSHTISGTIHVLRDN